MNLTPWQQAWSKLVSYLRTDVNYVDARLYYRSVSYLCTQIQQIFWYYSNQIMNIVSQVSRINL